MEKPYPRYALSVSTTCSMPVGKALEIVRSQPIISEGAARGADCRTYDIPIVSLGDLAQFPTLKDATS